jgi:hypothetical protein
MINRDINDFLESQEGLDNNSKRDLLKNIISKHIILTEGPLVLDYYDIISIIDRASKIYTEMSMPVKISDKSLSGSQASNYAIIESTIELLNNKGAIKRLPKFK